VLGQQKLLDKKVAGLKKPLETMEIPYPSGPQKSEALLHIALCFSFTLHLLTAFFVSDSAPQPSLWKRTASSL
jgi:hypothetical protein